MRICMVAYTFYETDNRVRRYAETLVKRGDYVEAITLRRKGQAPFEVIRGVHVFRIQSRTVDETHPVTYLIKLLLFFLRSSWRLATHHLGHAYDLIHVHSVPDFEVFSTLVPRLLGAKVILDIHDIVPELYASKFGISRSNPVYRLLLGIEWLSVRFADHVIVANHLWHERLIQRSALPERCTTILNYPDLSIFMRPRADQGSIDRPFTLFYPGTLSWHQGVDLIILAMVKLVPQVAAIKLVVCGDGPERERLKILIAEHHLEQHVSLNPGTSMEQVALTMVNIDLGIEPKRIRSFGNEALSTKIFEFMAMGVPVLASDTLINKRYFDHKLIGFFESENVDDLAVQILLLIQDRQRRSSLVENGLKHIARNNWTVKMHEYLEIVDSLVSTGMPASDMTGHASQSLQ